MDTKETIVDLTIRQGSQLIQTIFSSSPSDLPEIQALINAGAPLWYQGEGGLSALHAACFSEHSEVVQLLIDCGAIWNSGAYIWAWILFDQRVVCSR